MNNSYLYVTDGSVLQFGPQAEVLNDYELHCQNGKIIYCGPSAQAPPAPRDARRLKADNGLIMPGLINTHTHAAMTLMRGIADDLELHTWLNKHIFPVESKLNADAVYWGSLLACLEMIRGGTTCFADMYYFPHQTVKAVRQAGLRASLGETLLDTLTSTPKDMEIAINKVKDFCREHQKSEDIRPTLNLHSVYTCSPKLLRQGGRLSEELNIDLHMHLCETREELNICQNTYGKLPVAHIHDLGLLSSRLWLAHGVWINPEEAKVLAQFQVGVAHCPNSNMKLASGRADVPGMLDAGVKVALGTDGCASNNRLDMFNEMDVCAKMHKLATLDSTAMPAGQVLRMGTALAAQVLNRPALGELVAGALADFIVVDFHQPHLAPVNNYISHLVYAANRSDVRHTVCQGRVLMENRHIPHLDEEEIMARAKEQITRMLGR